MDSDADYPRGEEENELHHSSPSQMRSLEDPDLFRNNDPVEYPDQSGSEYAESENTDGEADANPTVNEDDGGLFYLKRPAEDAPIQRAFKRHKGVLNTEYLDLLNGDIEDAARRVNLSNDEDNEPSQLGLTVWSPLEKKLFFESIGRLGQGDLPNIASRIGTKSEVEVHHYLSILKRVQLMRQREGLRPAIEFSEYPAAVELSQPLCHALDEAADAVSVRQERKEEQREESKWGQCWNITPQLAQQIDNGEIVPRGPNFAFTGVLNIQNWLRLAERIFMNSSIPSDNWSFIDNHRPSMWATTFEDFHSLAVSITRRLVQTTIFLSMSRIRAKRELIPSTRDIVRRQDVGAAIASLGMTSNSEVFWLKSARRLRLEVFEEPPDRDEEVELEALTYDEVEEALSRDEDQLLSPEQEPTPAPVEEELTEFRKWDESDFETPFDISDGEDAAIIGEANEVLQYSAADFPETYRTKEALKNRISTERRQEQYAEKCDQYSSCQAEAEMWELLQRKPPMELPKVHEPGPVQRSKLDVQSIFPIERDWRAKIKYRSEWETDERPRDP
ncbi:hypothetical protein EDB81DRAFT_779503 [Dactylonectria macrodidyma]|uniref:Uncharacterized protein n=1 Tax=Dactylonectria macrodidyma TaxID=307937 RepID=A0A9P9FLB8_9HYPO|nr:hypothetical protein EDB81DRAFT_779503 [Dactylonectria macrodidyma]